MMPSLSNPAGAGSLFRAAGRMLPAAIVAALLGAVPASAVRPEAQTAIVHGKSNPYHNGFKHLRAIQTADLLDPGERVRQGTVALTGDIAAEVLRRLNGRLKPSGGEARIRATETDAKGNRHIRLDLFHRGFPVIGGDAVIHVNAANEVYAVGGSLAEGLSPAVSPKLPADSARTLARAGLSRPQAASERQAPRLVVFDGVLAYETLVSEPGPSPRLWKSYHDASTGELLFRVNRILDAAPVGGAAQNVTGSLLAGEGGTVATLSGWRDNLGIYFLRNNTALWGVYDAARSDWSQNLTGDWGTTDRAAVSLARNFETTQRYVSQVFGRNSYDNAGAFATANVHYGTSYVNAFWDGAAFYFGDGDGVESGPLTVLDVAAHEYGHSITQYTSNLDYVDESGALNESYSDILGTMVEFWSQPDGRSAYPSAIHGRADWLLGEDCWLSADALRDMRNPMRYGQPSYYRGTYWYDGGEVHTNSGVQNFAFYLLSEGGTASNDGHPYSITGLGVEQAGAIAWYANRYLLTSTSGYNEDRAAWILAATTLGYNAQTVRDVWTACGVLEQVHNLAVTPASLAFGNVGAGSSAVLNITLSNNGAIATTVSGLTFDNAAFTSAATLPLNVPGGGAVQVPVRFLPAATGAQAGALTITSTALDHPVLTVSLAGTGTPPAQIAVSPASISGSAPVGATRTATLHVANTGIADLRVTPRVAETGGPALQLNGTLNVLLLYAETSPIDFEAPLRALPNVANLSVWNGYASTPTLNDLRPFDVVVVTSNYSWVSPSAVGDALADYVDGGGAVILMGSTFHSGGNWALQGRIMTSGYAPLAAVSYTVSSTSLSTLASHPINAGVHTLTSGLYAYSTVPQGTGISLGTYVGGYLIGAYNPDKPIVSLNSFPQSAYYTGDLLVQVRNALDFVAKPRWLSIAGDGQEIVVPQGGSQDLLVTLDATNILGGSYTGNISLTHNDPAAANPLSVPVTFAVDGIRRLAVTPAALDFGTALTGMADTLSLTLANAGDEATTISGITFTGSADFSLVGSAPSSVPGRRSAVIQIEFRPHSVGAQTASLNIASDAEDNPSLTVSLTGTGAIPSMLRLTPDHIQADVDAGGTAVRTLTVGNGGGSDLLYSIAGNDGRVIINEFSNEPDFIELWNQGADRDLGGWRLSWVDDAGSSVLSFTFPSGYVLRSGRRVVVRENTGTANDSTFYAGANIGWVQGSTVAVTLADAAGTGIDFVRTLNSTTTPPAGTTWSGGGVDFSGYSAYHSQNADTDGPSGWATTMTPSEFLLNPGQSPVAALPAWLSIAPASGTVPAGASLDVTLSFNAAGLPAAAYAASVSVRSNDPSTPPAGIPVPVAFSVRGAPHLAATPSVLAFGNLWTGISRSLTLTLRNDGNQATTIASLASDNPRFTVPTGTLTVPAFGAVTVQVAFAPTDLGQQTGTLTIASDAQDHPSLTVSLSGAGTAPPVATLSPSSFALTLAPTQAPVDRTATLSNTGGDNLSWHIASIAQTGSPLGQAQAAPAPALPAIQSRLIYDESNYSHAYVPGRVIVGFKPGFSSFAGAHAAADIGIEEMRELARAIDPKTHRKAYAGRGLMLVELKDPDAVRQAIGILKQDANVAYAEPDYILKATAIPNDPSFGLLYGMRNTGQNGGTPGADIHATEAWDRHTGNRSILIGVIDTGIDYAHPDLVANIWTNPGEIPGNGIDDDGNGFIDDVHGWDFAYDDSNPTDGHYHGTHVSGTIAGIGDNGAGVAGVMWTASLVAIKFLDDSGSGTTSDAIDAVNYAHAMGVRVTNNSWGGGAFSQSLMDAIAAGGLFVAAAGNSSSDNDVSPQYPASYALDNIISVAATDNTDALASFSSYGRTTVDLGAPGVNIYSAQPGGLYQYLSGTSMATPHVTGTAGLVWSYNPTLTAAQVKAALLSSVDPDPALVGRTVTGGRLNARKALEAAGPSWLRAAPLQPGTLAPGATAPVTVTLDPAGLVAGRWTGVVNLATDDPLHADLPITVTADISGCRSLTVDASLDFGTLFTGTASRSNLTLRNACNDAVTISSASANDPAFTLAAVLPLQVPAFGTASVAVEFRPTAARSYAALLSLATDADTDPIKTVNLTGLGVDPPMATVNPASVSRTLAAGTSTVVDLDIGNTGGSDLAWTLSGVDRGFVPSAPYDATHFASMDKGQIDTRIGRPVTEASGGPDAFGYRWIDSDQPGGPIYQWQDIQSTGTQVISGCDDCYASQTLGFAFPFYGSSFTQVNISSNGYVTFGTPSSQFSNYPIPSTSMPANLVAAFFDDLYNGPIYFQDFGDRAVIQYQNVGYFSGSGTVTFQIVLHADGEIDYYYDNMTGSVLSATTGIQNATGTVGLQVQYNTAYIKNHLAVRINTLPAWLRVSAVSGTVPAGGDQHLALTLDASALRAGTYTQTMTLGSNNPSQAPISVPVTLTVTGQTQTGISRVLRVGPSALPAAGGNRYYMWNMTVGGEARGLSRGSRYTLYLK